MLQSARVYDAPRNHVRASYSQQVPVLDAAFQDDSHIFLGGLDGIVKRYTSLPSRTLHEGLQRK
jgi:hypothetical protein